MLRGVAFGYKGARKENKIKFPFALDFSVFCVIIYSVNIKTRRKRLPFSDNRHRESPHG